MPKKSELPVIILDLRIILKFKSYSQFRRDIVFCYRLSVITFRFVCFQFIGYAELSMIRDVTDLEVYRLSLEYLERVYKLTIFSPRSQKNQVPT